MSADDIAAIVIMYVVTWFVASISISMHLEDRYGVLGNRWSNSTAAARHTLAFLAGAAGPVLAPCIIGYMVGWGAWLGIRGLSKGIRDLWRMFVPKRIRLPKARVIK